MATQHSKFGVDSGGMSLIAAGAYLWALRFARHLSRRDVAVYFNTSDSQIERIERGENDTRGSMLFGFLQLVKGSPTHLMQLLLDTDATQEDGRRLAEEWLSAEEVGRIDAMIERHGRERVLYAVEQLRTLPEEELIRIIADASTILRERHVNHRSGLRRRKRSQQQSPESGPDDETPRAQ